ncbi:uncharacterized protein LOC111309902 isoform X3 [Durio zibethinus]|uniref:Uncharacterized protein LOC111309902 isoform X3 n=1 Tax=Durio zibethinus TaxID=66656 RepID=A0A6P6AIL4_DURZI|nr:uncharacterized protein LOC111309902 isoform X3 [Durio zibethinus]
MIRHSFCFSHQRLISHFQGSFTRPRIFWSGSSLQTEATAYRLRTTCHLIYQKILERLQCMFWKSLLLLVLFPLQYQAQICLALLKQLMC